MKEILLVSLLVSLPLQADSACLDFPPVPANQILSGFTPGVWELNTNQNGVYHCRDVALVQIDATGPIIATTDFGAKCVNDQWESSYTPLSLSCVVPPADFDKECEMLFIFPEGRNFEQTRILPLQPSFKYCPDNLPSILGDGTRFETIACAGSKMVNGTKEYNFDVKLPDGTTLRRTEYFDYLDIGCEVPLTCPLLPPIPANLIPSEFGQTKFKRDLWWKYYVCQGKTLAQFETDGPLFVIIYPSPLTCVNNKWVMWFEEDEVDDGFSTKVPIRISCVKPPADYESGSASVVLYDVKLLNGTIVRMTPSGGFNVKCGDVPTTTTTTVATTTTTKNPNCPPDGVWGEWTDTGVCSATCGACAVTTRKRICTTECGNCPCLGPSEDVGPCRVALCPFPSAVTCCGPHIKSLNQRTRNFFCGSAEYPMPVCSSTTTTSTTTLATTTTTNPNCPPEGVWGEWTETGACSATCGACAFTTRKRVCTIECGNCPCKGASEDIGPCRIALCPFPSDVTCCSPHVKSLNERTREFFCGLPRSYPKPVCSSTTTTSTTTIATTTTIKKDTNPTAAQLWDVTFYYNYGVGVHAFCADQTCINAIQSNGIGYDMVNGKGLLGRAVSESAIGAVRAACPTGSQNLRNLGFTKSGNKYLHNLSGSGLKQGWVALASGSCGATVRIKRWQSRYTDDMMYGVDLEWNTWYQGMVHDGGLVQFYMWN